MVIAELMVALHIQLVLNYVASLQISKYSEVGLIQLKFDYRQYFANFRKVLCLVFGRSQMGSDLRNELVDQFKPGIWLAKVWSYWLLV